MNKIRVERKDIYTIEVNDNGDTIEFDLVDIELPFRCDRALKEIDAITSELKGKLLVEEKKREKATNPKEIRASEEKTLELYRTAFMDMRVAMDEFLGAGACQKIFGDRNYIYMYDDLMEQLAPHFERMKLNTDGIRERFMKKYGAKTDDATLR